MSSEAETLTTCPRCRGGAGRVSCWLCKRTGLVSARVWEQWKLRGVGRSTSTTIDVRGSLVSTLHALKRQRTLQNSATIVVGETLLETLDAVRTGTPTKPGDPPKPLPSGEERAAVYALVSEWLTGACRILK